MLTFALVLLSAYLITEVNGVPAKPNHHHVLFLRRHHPRSSGTVQDEKIQSLSSAATPSADTDPSIMSSKHEFFPAIIAIIVCVSLAVAAGLAFIMFRLYKKRVTSTASDSSRPADMSSVEKFGNNHPISIPKPAMAAHPVMSSVSRGTHTRFSPKVDVPKYSFLDMNDDSMMNNTCCAHHAREPGEKDDVFSLIDDNESAFSFDVKNSTDRHSLRQSDLSKPCVTHGEPGWVINAYEGPEDTSQTPMH